MLGNAGIAKILEDKYGVKDIAPFDEIEYEIEYFSDKLSRVKISSKSGRCFCCPVYAIFDGYNMCWYGDYGFWGFNCTWETNVMNLAYNSPYYQLEKLRSRDRYEFDSDICEQELVEIIRKSTWFCEDLNEEQKTRFTEFISNSYDFIGSDDILSEHEDICEELKKLIRSAGSESEWIRAVNNTDFENSVLFEIFDCEQYEPYGIGKKVPGQYFIILYMLSVVANIEGCVKNDK